MSGPLRVLSLGAGVQSSTLLLMAAKGEFEHMPDVAIFADTGWEPRAVYEWLDWLEEQVRGIIPIRRVTKNGRNIRDDTLASLDGGRFSGPPVFIRPGDRIGPLRRQCTKEYKLEPIWAETRRLIGLKPRQRAPKEVVVEQWLGISMDEVIRMKPSQHPWIVHRWPLIEKGMDRQACLRWMERSGYPLPPKSACIGCLYHSDATWRDMRLNQPEEWQDAVEFDHAIRAGNLRGVEGEAYLHRSLKPLDEVDLSTPEERGQLNWLDECEGMCGV